MMLVESKSIAHQALDAAKAEIEADKLKKSVALFKDKLRAVATAQTILDNLKREVADLEAAIEQGNVP